MKNLSRAPIGQGYAYADIAPRIETDPAKQEVEVAARHEAREHRQRVWRLVVVVDEDIDPSNMNDVMWAIATRCEPSESVDILRRGWSSALDPRIAPQEKADGVSSNSKMIIDACRPWTWRESFPQPSALSIDVAHAVHDKWRQVLEGGATQASNP